MLSSDGHIVGHIDGQVVGPEHGITHLVLDHGHLWDHREVTIPIGEVDSVRTDVAHLRVPRDDVGGPPVGAVPSPPLAVTSACRRV